ncbi:MAG: hypothetical protein KJ964_11010 [Verrucomicrobia bacterium]|nr:hypothetical protein [Verrucomicrobiota bacterium]MBU1734144.1 hypothetical protein [Verrucomicrobiota bacterium]MBU1855394.1 hypothetical protein [Verrucomicrobiota bacterium]
MKKPLLRLMYGEDGIAAMRRKSSWKKCLRVIMSIGAPT